jgi:hypothetical protein
MRPDLGHIKDIPAIVLCFFRCHHLHVNGPRWEVSFINRLEEILQIVIGVDSSHPAGFFRGESLDPLVGFEVDFDVDK